MYFYVFIRINDEIMSMDFDPLSPGTLNNVVDTELFSLRTSSENDSATK
jgi:hypothetical protein